VSLPRTPAIALCVSDRGRRDSHSLLQCGCAASSRAEQAQQLQDLPCPLSVRRDDTWRDRARCVGMVTRDDDVWFTADSQSARDRGDTEAQSRAVALALCRSCPVIAACLAFALRTEQGQPEKARSGIFGGTTPEQRRRLMAQQ
jgi:hypothetical protein